MLQADLISFSKVPFLLNSLSGSKNLKINFNFLNQILFFLNSLETEGTSKHLLTSNILSMVCQFIPKRRFGKIKFKLNLNEFEN